MNSKKYFNDSQHSDVNIHIKSDENDNEPLIIKSHKIFLSMSSEYFQTIFETNVGITKSNELVIIYDDKNIMYDTIASIMI